MAFGRRTRTRPRSVCRPTSASHGSKKPAGDEKLRREVESLLRFELKDDTLLRHFHKPPLEGSFSYGWTDYSRTVGCSSPIGIAFTIPPKRNCVQEACGELTRERRSTSFYLKGFVAREGVPLAANWRFTVSMNCLLSSGVNPLIALVSRLRSFGLRRFIASANPFCSSGVSPAWGLAGGV